MSQYPAQSKLTRQLCSLSSSGVLRHENYLMWQITDNGEYSYSYMLIPQMKGYFSVSKNIHAHKYLEMILSWSDRATQQGQVQKVILCLSLTLCFRVNLPLKGQRPWPLHPPRLPTTHHPTPISSGYLFPKPCGEIGWGANQHLAPPSVLLHSNWWMVQLHPVSLS